MNLVSPFHKIPVEKLYGEICSLPLVFFANLKLSLELKSNIICQHQHKKLTTFLSKEACFGKVAAQ